MDVEIFNTTLIEVECILNSRPLTYASSDIRDLSVLRPADFLYPGVVTHTSSDVLPFGPVGGDVLRSRWAKVRELVDMFWERWVKEYVSTLQRREKWAKAKTAPYIGQLVLLVDETMPRDRWRIARVESFRREESHPRTITVRTADRKSFQRHISKLVPLEME